MVRATEITASKTFAFARKQPELDLWHTIWSSKTQLKNEPYA